MSTPNFYRPNPFTEFGKMTKRYGIARMIWSIFQMIAIIGMASSVFQTIDANDPEAMTNISGAELMSSFLYIILLIIGFIVILVFLGIYLSKLNNLANITMDSNLKKIFWFEIINIILVVFGDLIPFIGASIKLGLFIAIVFILEKWIQLIPSQTDKNPLKDSTKNFFLIMKIGSIFAFTVSLINGFVFIPGIFGPILRFLGQIIWGFGLMKIGDEIVASNLMPSAPSIQVEPVFNQTSNSSYGAPTYQAAPSNTQTFSTPTNFHTPTTINEVDRVSDKCKFCGATLIDKESSFCSTCGQKLR
ncbi:hypothetical protein NEF87_004058 [Candidatus Lokiarchaeum ossiferum]|uniref:Zinc ribbon domain-containing protein n=1 Tax=Candidatus Lokiarchaeum ossiferum TaxID=2951803 RepID=A0ABY6HW65_9ARCH|nr:hypothetical protein NEF87_004058 [Candidatus Lokiarchaeum sp. B-35]